MNVAVVTGSFMTTFDGATIETYNTGSLNLVRAGDTTVQAQFAPCAGDALCRTMTEVAFSEGNTVISMTVNDDGQISVRVTERGSDVEVEYPFNLNTPTLDAIELDWDNTG